MMILNNEADEDEDENAEDGVKLRVSYSKSGEKKKINPFRVFLKS